MGVVRSVVGAVVTVVIGGTVYTVSQSDIVDNFAQDTGLTQQQAREYVDSVGEDDLESWDKIGTDYISDGREVLDAASDIDCSYYEYDWESRSLTCQEGKSQLYKIGNDEIGLGNALRKLSDSSVSKTDISEAIRLIDKVNQDYELSIVGKVLNFSVIDDFKKGNSYNKAVLQAVLEAE